MKALKKILYSTLLLAIVWASGGLLNIKIDHAYAADCASPGPAAQLALYTTDKSDFTRPATSLDPQTVMVGQTSMRMEAEIEDVNNCPVPAPSTVRITISSDALTDVLTTGGVNNGNALNATIATGNTRGGFLVKGKNIGTSSLQVVTRVDSTIQLTSGAQTVAVVAPVPVFSKLSFTNNTHGIADTVSGVAGAVATTTTVPAGITVRAYTSDGSQLLGSVVANADGSFDPIATGDDQYRQVLVKAEYPGGVLSDGVLVDQSYPSIVTGLVAKHDTATDYPTLTWTSTEAGATYRVYRIVDSAMPVFTEADFVRSTTNPTYADATATVGVTYRYSVKQVVAGSYTPEFMPTATSRIDITQSSVAPNSPTAQNKPLVTATVSPSVYATPSVLSVKFINNQDATKTYIATVAVSGGQTMTAGAPFNTTLQSLPDGAYTVTITARDNAEINDTVVVSSAYSIDTVAPTAPVSAKLRYSTTTHVLGGITGATEVSTRLDIFSDATLTTLVGRVDHTNDDGAFSLAGVAVPQSGVFYLVSYDATGNKSAATVFDVIHAPAAPIASKVTLRQNTPGTNDVIVGVPGAVGAGQIVRIYAADPGATVGLVPFRELIAASDGSFSAEVGDNASGAFWITVWSGSGLESTSIKLTNTMTIAAPTSFTASSGDGSVTLDWSAVTGASSYNITIYKNASGEIVSRATVTTSQTSLTISLTNGTTYRFVLTAMDAFGNVSAGVESTATPKAAVIQKTVSTAKSTSAPSSSTVSPTESPVVSEQAPADTASTAPATSQDESSPWASVIIGIGVLSLIIAGFAAAYLWGKYPTETVVKTIKKPATPDAKPKTEIAPETKDDSQPRW